jgi:hypothetical protein
MLDIHGYKHTLRVCNAYCFSKVTLANRTRLTVTLYVVCTLPVLSLRSEHESYNNGNKVKHKVVTVRLSLNFIIGCWGYTVDSEDRVS